MRALSGPGDLVATVADRFGNHPWARLCAASTPAWSGGEDRGDAVVWRSARPWSAAPELHALGPGAGAAVEAERRPGEAAVSSVPAVATGSRPHGWTLRLRSTPGDLVPGEDRVTWLDDDRDVTHLLAAANPVAEIRPRDPRAGRWCGVRDPRGVLIACGVETVLAAPRAHLSSLAVHPAARGSGLGAAVTSWFTRASLAAGAPEVVLGVEDDNAPGMRLYDRLGFDAWPMLGWSDR